MSQPGAQNPAPAKDDSSRSCGLGGAFAAARLTALIVMTPGMTYLILLVLGWTVPALLIMSILLLAQLPIFWACNLLKSARQHGNG
jgi:hypothetical protein